MKQCSNVQFYLFLVNIIEVGTQFSAFLLESDSSVIMKGAYRKKVVKKVGKKSHQRGYEDIGLNSNSPATGGHEYLGSYLPPTREDCLASCGFSHFFPPAGPPQPQCST